ncbi:MAG: hypothetical protein HYU36_02630 [Planctomycetes bacterium]|nr:hypothetical protein [Planctomycetota bacterium]
MQCLEEAKKRIYSLVDLQTAVWLFVVVMPSVLAIDALRKLPPLPLLGDALPEGMMSAGTTFFILLVIVATGVGAYGYGVCSWTLVSMGFALVVFHLTILVLAGCWYLLSGLWHLVAVGIFALREWGFGDETRHHTVEAIFTLIALGFAFLLFRLVLKALKPAYEGILVLGRAQEIENPFMAMLASLEGKERDEILFLLLRNSLARCVAISLVGHFIVINVLSIPQAINAVAESIKDAAAAREEQIAKEKEAEKAGGKKPGEALKPVGKGGKGGEVAPPAGKGSEPGKPGEEPGVEFNTPAATSKPGGSEAEKPEEGPDENAPSGNATDYDKHKAEPKKKGAGDEDFGDLDGSDGENLIKKD